MSEHGYSRVWDFFDCNQENNMATCKICNKTISFKSTVSNLKLHLRLKHLKAYKKFLSTSFENIVMIVDSEENQKDIINLNSSKNSRSKNSELWSIFERIEDTKVALCKLCHKKISFKTNIGNLKQHLKKQHLFMCNKFSSLSSSSPPHNALVEDRPEVDDSLLVNSDESRPDQFSNSKVQLSSGHCRSHIWKVFEKIENTTMAICKFCQKQISFKTTITNLKKHLKLKHPVMYQSYISLRSSSSSNISIENYLEEENSQMIPYDDNCEEEQLEQDKFINSKYSTNNKNDIWNFFEKIQHTKKALCNLCHQEISFKTTISNLKEHLKIKHCDIYNNLTLNMSSSPLHNFSNGNNSEGENSQDSIKHFDVNNDSNSKKSLSPSQSIAMEDSSEGETSQQDKVLMVPKVSSSLRSEIWNFFVEDHINKIAQCNQCQKSLSYKTSITNLKKHLKSKHKQAYTEFISRSDSSQNFQTIYVSTGEEEQTSGIVFNDDDNKYELLPTTKMHSTQQSSSEMDPFNDEEFIVLETSKNIQNMSSIYLPKNIQADEKNKIDRCLLKLITEDFQPFSIVEERGFQKFVAALNPNYQLPNHKTLSKLLLQEYTNRLSKYKQSVQQCLSISLTLDYWTSRNMQSFMAVTGHFIDKNSFEFRTVLIQCAALHGQHTAERIASELSQIAVMWGITNKINFIVSDSASNMISAARLLNWPHFGCYARKLNSIVQVALNENSVANILTKVQKTVAYFKRSSTIKEMLLEYQVKTQQMDQPKSLLLSIPTRWVSVYLMIKRFSELEEALHAIILNIKEEIPDITSDEWQCIGQMVEVLKPFEEAATIMNAENYLIASKAVVLTAGLYTACTDFAKCGLHEAVTNLALKLRHGLTTNFGDIEKNKEISICTLLDPRFKQHAFEDQTAILNAKQSILEKFYQINQENDSNINDVAGLSVSNEPMSSLWGRFYAKIAASHHPEITETKIKDELNMYMSENVIPPTECPLKWWKKRKMLYPILSKTFIACSNIVVTSLPCERAFTKIGYVLSDRRTRLTTSKVDKIMFLNVNK